MDGSGHRGKVGAACSRPKYGITPLWRPNKSPSVFPSRWSGGSPAKSPHGSGRGTLRRLWLAISEPGLGECQPEWLRGPRLNASSLLRDRTRTRDTRLTAWRRCSPSQSRTSDPRSRSAPHPQRGGVADRRKLSPQARTTAVLTQARGRLEPLGERIGRGKRGEAAIRTYCPFRCRPPKSLVRGERPKPGIPAEAKLRVQR